MYHRGTLTEFEAWHEEVKISEGIPTERTTAYSVAVQNPNSSNDCVWLYGNHPIQEKEVLTYEDFLNLGWFSGT